MDSLLGQIFGPKCTFMGYLPAGKRKWVKTRSDGTMEVIRLQFDRGLVFPSFGLSFPWIPHGNGNNVCWHKTAKNSVIDLPYRVSDVFAWSIPKGRIDAAAKANIVSTEVCERCEPWFKVMNVEGILNEFESWRTSGNFYPYVQILTAYWFWQARSGRFQTLDDKSERQLKSYFGEDGFPRLKQLLEEEAARAN